MTNVFIFGSCVSRDTRPFLGDDWKMIEYVARQSLISAAAGKTSLPGTSKLTSAFQNKCLQNDFNGSFMDTLTERASETDVVLMDLVDERLGVRRTSDGGYVTNSWELAESGLVDGDGNGTTLIDFATDEHFRLWCAAADKIVEAIENVGLPLIVLAPAWAQKAENGGGVDYRRVPSEIWNGKYVRYFDHLERMGVNVIRVSAEEVVASTTHQWGLAAFHYGDKVYATMQTQIKEHYAASMRGASAG